MQEPIVEVPTKDHWIYKNPKALKSLLKGLKDAEEGRLYDLGSFAKYATEDDTAFKHGGIKAHFVL
jgi:hypothetical protein